MLRRPGTVVDVAPGADAETDDDPELPNRRRLNALARDAEALVGGADPKLTKGVNLIKKLVLFLRSLVLADRVRRHL